MKSCCGYIMAGFLSALKVGNYFNRPMEYTTISTRRLTSPSPSNPELLKKIFKQECTMYVNYVLSRWGMGEGGFRPKNYVRPMGEGSASKKRTTRFMIYAICIPKLTIRWTIVKSVRQLATKNENSALTVVRHQTIRRPRP